MPEDADFPCCQVVAVLPRADQMGSQNPSGLWKILDYYLLRQNAQGVKVAEAIQAALMTGVPYLVPFFFSRFEAESMATELRGLGYKVRVLASMQDGAGSPGPRGQ